MGSELKPVAWLVNADSEDWITRDEDEASANRDDGLNVRPLVFGDTRPKQAGVTEAMVTRAEDYYYDNSPFNGPDELREGLRGCIQAALGQEGEK